MLMNCSDKLAKACPRCHSDAHVMPKLLLIGKASPAVLFPNEEKAGYQRRDQVSIDECNPAFLQPPPLEQFVSGYYCAACGVGFVLNNLVNS
jgi:hypothetical protein